MGITEKAQIKTPEATKEISFSYEDLLNNPELKKLPQGPLVLASLEMIKRSYEKDPHESFLGEGDTAKVFQSKEGTAQNACMKIMHRLKGSHNTINKEMEIHAEAYKTGARIPRPQVSVELESGVGCMVMERITGNSVKDHLEKNIPFPEGFDLREFIKSLKIELEKLHNNNIFHRDLHNGNVMIDESGNPVIIDFGAAKKTFLSSEDPYKESYLNNVVTFMDDDHAVTQIRSDIQNRLLQQKKKGGEAV